MLELSHTCLNSQGEIMETSFCNAEESSLITDVLRYIQSKKRQALTKAVLSRKSLPSSKSRDILEHLEVKLK